MTNQLMPAYVRLNP